MDTFEQLCQHRRSIRVYQNRPVEREKLEYILRCALMSPSGKRINPWEFTVVTDSAVIRRMEHCKEGGNTMLSTAPAVVVVALDEAASGTWREDGAIAAQNMMLAAADQGLGSCWCQILDRPTPEGCDVEWAEDVIRRLTGIGTDRRILCLVTIGYAEEERRPYDPAKLLYDKVNYLE